MVLWSAVRLSRSPQFFYRFCVSLFDSPLLYRLLRGALSPVSAYRHHHQLMVVGLVQKCTRDAKAEGRDPPTDLGFLLKEFFDFYGNQLDYATTGEPPWGVYRRVLPRPVD